MTDFRVSLNVTVMRRKRDRTGLYRSSQVAKILGMSPRTLYRMLADGRIPEPMRNPENRYRMWTEVDLQSIREVLQR
jgi:excisionase family DNA binding protein